MFWIIFVVTSASIGMGFILAEFISDFRGRLGVPGCYIVLNSLLLALFILIVVPGWSVQEEDLTKDKNRVSELIVITNATVTKVERAERIEELINTIERYNNALALCGKNNKNKDNMFYIHFSNFDVSKYEFMDLEKIIEELKGE